MKSVIEHLKDIELPNTVEACHVVIRDLMKVISELSHLVHRVEKLEAENQALKERLNIHSGNSSLPPSKSKKKKTKNTKSSGRSSGGQPGHLGYFRKLLDTAEVDHIVDCALPSHCTCGGEMLKDETVQRHQVFELPEIKLTLTEYRLAKGRCVCCRRAHTASLPVGITMGITGPGLRSFMTELVAKYHLSRRELKEFLKTHLRFDLSLGTVFNKQKLVNAVLEVPISQLLPAIKAETSVHIDETGHQQDGHNAWMWLVASKMAAYFTIAQSRGGINFALVS